MRLPSGPCSNGSKTMFWLRIVAKVVSALREGESPAQLAWGLVLGLVLGLTPGWPLQAWLLLLVIFLLRINLPLAVVGATLGGLAGLVLGGPLDALGWWLLHLPALQGLWVALYSSGPGALTRFNHTVTLGALVVGLVALPLLVPAAARGVVAYRQRLWPWLMAWGPARAMMSSRLGGLALKILGMGGA